MVKYLEKKAYFDLCNGTMKFVFLEPGSAGLCLAYTDQHAFHRLEKHKQETSLQYTMWRFAKHYDKESIEFSAPLLLSERRRKTFLYEVKWYFELNEANVWV